MVFACAQRKRGLQIAPSGRRSCFISGIHFMDHRSWLKARFYKSEVGACTPVGVSCLQFFITIMGREIYRIKWLELFWEGRQDIITNFTVDERNCRSHYWLHGWMIYPELKPNQIRSYLFYVMFDWRSQTISFHLFGRISARYTQLVMDCVAG